MPAHTTIVLASLFIFALVSGCGGSDQGSDGGGHRGARADGMTKARYVKEADATCKEQNDQLRRKFVSYLGRGAGSRYQARAATGLIEKVFAPDFEYEIRSIRALVLPAKDVEQVARLLDAMLEVVKEAERDPVGFIRADQPFVKPERLARQYGFAVCGGFSVPEGP